MDPLAALSGVAAGASAPHELDAPQQMQQQQWPSEAPQPSQRRFLPGNAPPPTAVSPSMRLASILNASPSEPQPQILLLSPPCLLLPPPVHNSGSDESSAPAPLVAVGDSPQQQLMRGAWTKEEKAAVLEGYDTLGAEWALIVKQFVPTRTVKQAQTFYSRWRRTRAANAQPARDVSAAASIAAAAGAPQVLDLSLDDSHPPQAPAGKQLEQRRPRRETRSRPSDADAAPAARLPDVIEIHTEESAEETPQKATRTRLRDPRPPLPSAKSSRSQAARKKAKLAAAALGSPSSSSVASGASVAKPRGKKRPAVEFEGIPLPPATASLSSPFDERACEFCSSPFGVCAIVHCAACRRVYHPRCVVSYYTPYCSRDDEPIEAQLAALQLNAPPQVRVNMFRCASCLAACIESFRSGVYEWDCACPSCSQPQKLVEYRSRMLFHLMYGGGDVKPARKQKGVAKGNSREQDRDAATQSSGGSDPVAAAVRGARRRGRSSASASETEVVEVDSEVPSVEASDAANETLHPETESTPGESSALDDGRSKCNEKRREAGGIRALENGDGAGAAEPEREEETPASAGEVELSDAEILAAVTVSTDEKRLRIFPIVCTETVSLTVSGLMKAGRYYVHRSSTKPDLVCCDCCSKTMPREQFVRHTDAAFLDMTGKTVSDFLFAAHRDGTNHVPLDKFLRVLKQHKVAARAAAPDASRKPLAATTRNGSRASASEGTSSPDEPPTEVAIANALQLLKTTLVVRRGSTSRSTKPGYLVKLVCMSTRLMIRMANGVVQSKLDPSTPGQAFPYKEGWLSFEKGAGSASSASAAAAAPLAYASVRCSCCLADMQIEDFIMHTGLTADELELRGGIKYKRRHVFVPQLDRRTLVEFDKVWQAMITLHFHHQLDAFLSRVSDTVTL